MTRKRALLWIVSSFLITIGSFVTVWHGELHATTPAGTATRLINAKSTTAQSPWPTVGGPMANCQESAVYIDWSTGVTAGGVTIETAVDQNYTGTWAPLIVVAFSSTAPRQDVVQITGVHWAIRSRISTNMTGGTVTTWLVCN